jgi:hypothetical protein
MKKFLMVLLTATFTLGMVACGGQQATKADSSASKKPAKKGLKKMKGNRMEVAEEDE